MHTCTPLPVHDAPIVEPSSDRWEAKYFALLAVTTLQMSKRQINRAAALSDRLGFANTEVAFQFREMATDLRVSLNNGR